MKKAKSYIQKLISFFFLMATITFAHAQTVEADANGNVGLIYVVVGVIVIILAGLIFYLTTIDRKLSKLEKEIKNK